MLQNLPQKIFRLQGAVAFLLGAAFDVAESDLPIPTGDDVFLRDDETKWGRPVRLQVDNLMLSLSPWHGNHASFIPARCAVLQAGP